MIDLLIDKLHDTRFLASLLAAIAAMATVITLAMPLLARDDLNRRLWFGLSREDAISAKGSSGAVATTRRVAVPWQAGPARDPSSDSRCRLEGHGFTVRSAGRSDELIWVGRLIHD